MALALRTRFAGVPTRRVNVGKSLLPAKPVLPARRQQADVRAKASEEMDFDAVLGVWAEKFEKVENKPIVVAYIVAAVTALITTEWLIHLPALDIVLGFPIQLVGVVMGPVLILRYLVDKKDLSADLLDTVADISKRLPGLEEKK